MFGLFKKKTAEPLTFEQKIAFLAECGMSLAPPFTMDDLLESWTHEQLEEPGFNMALICLGMTEEQPPWRHHCVNVWHFDTECIEDEGSYVRIAERMAEMTQGSLVLENVRDQVDIESALARLHFELAGKSVHLDFKVNDDWVDPAVLSYFVQVLDVSDPSKVFLYHDNGGQDCIIACVTREQFHALTKAGVNFELLR